jgi:hypothetical protein
MKSKLDPDTTPAQNMKHFERWLGRILIVSKAELQQRITVCSERLALLCDEDSEVYVPHQRHWLSLAELARIRQ